MNFFLSGDKYLPGGDFVPGVSLRTVNYQPEYFPKDPYVAAGDAMRAYDAGSVAVFFDRRQLKNATGVLLVAIPTCARSTPACASARTSPLFIEPYAPWQTPRLDDGER